MPFWRFAATCVIESQDEKLEAHGNEHAEQEYFQHCRRWRVPGASGGFQKEAAIGTKHRLFNHQPRGPCEEQAGPKTGDRNDHVEQMTQGRSDNIINQDNADMRVACDTVKPAKDKGDGT